MNIIHGLDIKSRTYYILSFDEWNIENIYIVILNNKLEFTKTQENLMENYNLDRSSLFLCKPIEAIHRYLINEELKSYAGSQKEKELLEFYKNKK